jgi:hypothetical protein
MWQPAARTVNVNDVMPPPKPGSSEADLDEIAEALRDELGDLVDMAETVLAELEAIEELRASGPHRDQRVGAARNARRDAMRTRTEAVDLIGRAHDVCAQSRALEVTLAERIASARALTRH